MSDVGQRYDGVRQRLTRTLRTLDSDAWRTPVAACPEWNVHDVVAHLVGIIEDAMAGRLDGPPTPEQTAEQVSRHRTTESSDLLATWDELGPGFATAIPDGVWPAFLDVLSHECDIATALGEALPRADIGADVGLAASLLADTIDTPAGQVRFAVEGEGDPAADDEFLLAAPAFEIFRLRLGRRTRQQVEAMSWSQDPASVIDEVFIFGPTAKPIGEGA